MAKPVLVIVDDEDASRRELTRELESRYGAHYQIVALPSPETALARLTGSGMRAWRCRWFWLTTGCRG